MSQVVCCVLLVVLGAVSAFPGSFDLLSEVQEDTATVESIVREARAAPQHIDDLLKPGVKDAFLHVYGDAEKGDGDAHGYTKKTQDQGRDGYKHFDSFHKKDGDKWGYESHKEFGQENKAHADGDGKKGKKSDKDGEETQSYQVFEELDEGKKDKKAVDDFGFYGDGDSDEKAEADDGNEESYEESDGDSQEKELDGENEEYHESDSGEYESEGDGEKENEEDDY